jgi:hypothetical protein
MATITNPRSNEQDSVLERLVSAQDRNDQRIRNALVWGLSRVPGVAKAGQLLNELMLEQMFIRSSASVAR